MIENEKYIIFSITEIEKINFNEVLETSVDTVRISSDGLKTFVRWDTTETPQFVSSITTKEGPYTNDQMISILSVHPWFVPTL
jgi:hypothetical protein